MGILSTTARAGVLCLAWLAGAAHGQTITVSWRDKPPYHYTENGVDKGFLLERAHQLFDAAGIATRFVKEPNKRIFANFQSGMSNYCSIGWYYLEERTQYAQFSAPFHTDRPHTIVASRAAAPAVERHPSLASLLADKKLVLGTVDGVSYGPQIDKLIAGSANQIVKRTVEPGTMMRMLAAGRASFIFMDREDWEFAQAHDPATRTMVQRDFPDMPPGLQRFILCSKDVSPAIMGRLNKAIEANHGKP